MNRLSCAFPGMGGVNNQLVALSDTDGVNNTFVAFTELDFSVAISSAILYL